MKNTLSLVAIAVLALAMTGCGRTDRWIAGITGSATKECVDGVQYLQFTSGASVAYDSVTGGVKRCR